MNTIHVVFDGPPSHESGRFVEVETPDGKSINVGEWHQRPDNLWELRIPNVAQWQPIETAPKDGTEIFVCGGDVYCSSGMGHEYPLTGVATARWKGNAYGTPFDWEWQGEMAEGYEDYYWHKPTLWMPMPVAPTEQIGEA